MWVRADISNSKNEIRFFVQHEISFYGQHFIPSYETTC